MHAAAPMICLTRFFSFPILVFKPCEIREDDFLSIVRAKHVVLPSFRLGARQPIARHLREDVCRVERFCGGKMQSCPQRFRHLVSDPFVIRKGPFVRRDRPEDVWVAALLLAVDQRTMTDFPKSRRPRRSFRENTHRDLRAFVLLRP